MNLLCYICLTLSIITNKQNVLIGDSQTFLLKKHSTIVTHETKLSKVGIGVPQLITKIKNYSIQPNVLSVTICIGVNDGYIDKGISQLMIVVKRTFPNARIYIIKGSWGWGQVKTITKDKFNNYYKKFEDLGAHIIQTPIGYGDPHKNKKVYKTIMSELEWKLKQLNPHTKI
jgi:hypothetical protein